MCMIDEAEPLDFCCTKIRTARIPHICDECDRQIHPKERYTYSTFGLDGNIGANKRCSHCEIPAQWLIKHCDGYYFDSIKDELEGHYSEGYRKDGLSRLLIGVRRKWQAFSGGGLLSVPRTNHAH